MADLGCTLTSLEIITTNVNALRSKLSAIGASRISNENGLREGDVDELVVTLQTPLGERRLSSRTYSVED